MRNLLKLANRVHTEEDGHAPPAVLSLVAGVGAVLLGIGAGGALAIIGGIVLGVGLLGASVVSHMNIDYAIFARLEKLEGKK